MAEELPPCCQRARLAYVKRLTSAIVNYPVIKNIPCPTCKRIIAIRLYAATVETSKNA